MAIKQKIIVYIGRNKPYTLDLMLNGIEHDLSARNANDVSVVYCWR